MLNFFSLCSVVLPFLLAMIIQFVFPSKKKKKVFFLQLIVNGLTYLPLFNEVVNYKKKFRITSFCVLILL